MGANFKKKDQNWMDFLNLYLEVSSCGVVSDGSTSPPLILCDVRPCFSSRLFAQNTVTESLTSKWRNSYNSFGSNKKLSLLTKFHKFILVSKLSGVYNVL